MLFRVPLWCVLLQQVKNHLQGPNQLFLTIPETFIVRGSMPHDCDYSFHVEWLNRYVFVMRPHNAGVDKFSPKEDLLEG